MNRHESDSPSHFALLAERHGSQVLGKANAKKDAKPSQKSRLPKPTTLCCRSGPFLGPPTIPSGCQDGSSNMPFMAKQVNGWPASLMSHRLCIDNSVQKNIHHLGGGVGIAARGGKLRDTINIVARGKQGRFHFACANLTQPDSRQKTVAHTFATVSVGGCASFSNGTRRLARSDNDSLVCRRPFGRDCAGSQDRKLAAFERKLRILKPTLRPALL